MYEYFERLLQKNGVTAYKVAKETGITTATLTSWKQGKYIPKNDKIQKIADYFNVPLSYFETGEEKSTLPEGAVSIDMQKVLRLPVLGSIRCGEPMFAESNTEGYEYVHTSLIKGEEEHFCLRAKGDSMINAGIADGDLLLIRKQSDVDNNEIAVVTINGDEATLKRIVKKENAIVLQPENTGYETKIFVGKEMSLLTIQGRLMSVTKKF